MAGTRLDTEYNPAKPTSKRKRSKAMSKKQTAKPAWATKGKEWMEDNDDAHFEGNPAYKPHNRKKVTKKPVVVAGKLKAQGPGQKPVAHKKTTRKRVAGK